MHLDDGPATADGRFDYRQLDDASIATGKFAPVSESAWFLTGQGDETAGMRFVALNTMPFRFGRRSDLSLCLPFKTVSSLHAMIFQRGENPILRDLGSTNGTFVNGVQAGQDVELKEGDLIQFANIAFRLVKHATGLFGQTAVCDVGDQALALTRFDELLSERAVVPHFQPIVQYVDGAVVGYEVLGRSRLFGLNNAKQMFLAAAQLNLETELSRMLRIEGIKKGALIPGRPPLYVNTHPLETEDPQALYASLEEIRKINPDQPITLEIHESSAINLDTMSDLRQVLDSLDMKLAYDDFGAGQARLVELVRVSPDCLKFDMTLVQNIHQADEQHQQMLGALVQMARGLGISPLAEGVESEEDSQVCKDLGFEFAQGYLYGRPAPASTFNKPSDVD